MRREILENQNSIIVTDFFFLFLFFVFLNIFWAPLIFQLIFDQYLALQIIIKIDQINKSDVIPVFRFEILF